MKQNLHNRILKAMNAFATFENDSRKKYGSGSTGGDLQCAKSENA